MDSQIGVFAHFQDLAVRSLDNNFQLGLLLALHLVWDGHGTLLLGHPIDGATVAHDWSFRHLDFVKNKLVLSITKILYFNSSITGVNRFSIDEEVNRRTRILDLNIENDFFSFNALFEVSHSLLEGIVIFDS